MAGDHQFDRRKDDVNVGALAVQMQSLGKHVHESMTPELRANTLLTKQIHETLTGRGDDSPGLISKVEEMHDAFAAAKGGLKALETIGSVAKPLAAIFGLCAALWLLLTTGHWMPPK